MGKDSQRMQMSLVQRVWNNCLVGCREAHRVQSPLGIKTMLPSTVACECLVCCTTSVIVFISFLSFFPTYFIVLQMFSSGCTGVIVT